MSVGGKVTYIKKLHDGDLRVATNEPQHPHDIPTCVHVADTPQTRCIEPGDSFWWQGKVCYWTPKGAQSERETVKIPRKSTSYSDPEAELIEKLLNGR
jgi:hypothetical protein